MYIGISKKNVHWYMRGIIIIMAVVVVTQGGWLLPLLWWLWFSLVTSRGWAEGDCKGKASWFTFS